MAHNYSTDGAATNSQEMLLEFYSALPLTPRQFRLLRVYPGTFDEDIHCELFVSELDDCETNYEPLSYVCGTQENLQRIFLNGRRFFVTINLESALRYLRHVVEERILWADTVCIDQLDYSERERQVMLMSDIYSKCQNVIIWLGCEQEASDDIDEPAFLREPSAEQPVYLNLTPDPVTGKITKFFHEPGSRSEEDIDISSVNQPFVPPPTPCLDFTQKDKANTATEQVQRFVKTSGQCAFSDDWIYQGRRNDNTLFALCFLHLLAQDEHPRLSYFWDDFCHRSNVLRILSRITRRPWWTRIWTVQEVLLPPMATVYFDSFTVPWTTFSQAALNFARHRESCCSKVLSGKRNHEMDVLSYFCAKVEDIEEMRNLYSTRDLDLLSTLRHTRSRNSTNPRDKIYGIRGITLQQSTNVNYSIPIFDLYRDVAFSIIRREGNYSILSGLLNKEQYPNLPDFIENPPRSQYLMYQPKPKENDDYPDEHPELYPLAGLSKYNAEHIKVWPTWLPDFACPSSPFERERLHLLSIYNASNGIKPPCPDSHVGLAAAGGLQIQSICVGVVTDVGEAMFIPRSSSHNPTLKQWHSVVQKRYTSEMKQYDGQPGHQRYPNGDDWTDAYWRTLCADVVPEDRRQNGFTQSHSEYRRTNPADRAAFDCWYPNPTSGPGTYGTDGVGFSTLGPRDPSLSHDHDNTIGTSVKTNTFLRSFFITDGGHMGLGPLKLRAGDEVHVLIGGRTPFVLRPQEVVEGPYSLQLYFLVGDCYLHGFMDGEALIKCTPTAEGNKGVFMTVAARKKLQRFPEMAKCFLTAVQLHTDLCVVTAEGEMPLRFLV
jgi:hypothetical protein